VLDESDMGELEMAAMAYEFLHQSFAACYNDGPVWQAESGYRQKSGDWQIWMDARKVLSEFYNKYGFNLVTRQRLDLRPVEDDMDEIEKLKSE